MYSQAISLARSRSVPISLLIVSSASPRTLSTSSPDSRAAERAPSLACPGAALVNEPDAVAGRQRFVRRLDQDRAALAELGDSLNQSGSVLGALVKPRLRPIGEMVEIGVGGQVLRQRIGPVPAPSRCRGDAGSPRPVSILIAARPTVDGQDCDDHRGGRRYESHRE